MKTGIVISALLEPLSKKDPTLIEENDLRLNILETLQKGPLNLSDLREKTGLNQRKLTQTLSDMEKEGTVAKLKTRYEITHTGLGIVNGFIEPSADQRLDVIAQLAKHPNSSTKDLLRLRSQSPGYLEVVELTSILDVLKDKKLIERNGHGWVLGKSLLEKITRIIGVPKESEKDTKVEVKKEKEVERPKPRTKETKIVKERVPADKKSRIERPATPTPLVVDTPPAPIVVDTPPTPLVVDMPPVRPVDDKLTTPLDTPPTPLVVDTPPVHPDPARLADPFIFTRPTKTAAATVGSFSGNGAKQSSSPDTPQIKPNPNLGIQISNSIRRSELINEQQKAVRFLKTAILELKKQGVKIEESSLTDKSNHSEEVIETLHIFFVLKSDRIREILKFCSQKGNVTLFGKLTPLLPV